MAWLTFVNGPDKGLKIEISSIDKDILIGREASKCDLVLDDPKVSRIHARVRLLPDNKLEVEDCNCRNGIFIYGKRIDGAGILGPGEIFRIGGYQIKYENTLFPLQRVYLEQHVLSNGDTYSPADGHTRSLRLSQQGIITIGRDPSNNFVLNHPLVSRYHARIVSQNGRHTVYDLNSTNGVYVNGKRIIDSAELFPSSLIQICGYRYIFDGQTLIEYDETSGQVRIEVSHLTKKVNLPGGKERFLLNDINLIIEPREFVAILGGSGAGKSTLMGALTAMNPATSGKIMVNGRDLYREYNSFRSMIGYVPQDDIVHMELTVKEVLTYSARLRMPDDATEAEIKKAVETALSDLELTSQKDLQVKNLSGGQRKRVSIGVELLTMPGLFFLDEPTSGLDPGLEKIMMELLRKLADQGRIIVLVTHATFNISLCDKVVFLTKEGKLAFFGPPGEAFAYFGVSDFAEIYKKIAVEKSPDEWSRLFIKSSLYQNNIGSRLSKISAVSENKNLVKNMEAQHRVVKASSLKQWWVLTKRYARILSMDRKNLFILFIQAVVIASMIVMVYVNNAPLFKQSKYQAKDLEINQQVFASGQFEQVQDNNQIENKRRANMKISLALMVFTTIWLGTSNAAREIIKELPIYKRERLIKLRIAPYLLSKIAVQSLVCLAQTAILVTIVSLGLGLPHFWLSLSAFFIISFSSMVMGLTVSAIATNMDKALSAVQLLLIPQIILSGSIIPINDVEPEFFQNVFYLAISKWGYELVGGGICKINDKVALSKPLPELSGNFTGHWWILAGFAVVLYVSTTLVLLKKDNQLS